MRSNGDFFSARTLPSPALFPHFLPWGREGKWEREDEGFGLVVFFRFVSCPLFRVLFAFVLIVDFWFSLLFFGFGCLFV